MRRITKLQVVFLYLGIGLIGAIKLSYLCTHLKYNWNIAKSCLIFTMFIGCIFIDKGIGKPLDKEPMTIIAK